MSLRATAPEDGLSSLYSAIFATAAEYERD